MLYVILQLKTKKAPRKNKQQQQRKRGTGLRD